jgi:hypothetical protein
MASWQSRDTVSRGLRHSMKMKFESETRQNESKASMRRWEYDKSRADFRKNSGCTAAAEPDTAKR